MNPNWRDFPVSASLIILQEITEWYDAFKNEVNSYSSVKGFKLPT